MFHFKVANVLVSLWLVHLVGLAAGFLAGSIGVGGFVGVPAMIYLALLRAKISDSEKELSSGYEAAKS